MAMNQTCKPEMTLRFFFSIERKKLVASGESSTFKLRVMTLQNVL
jgi:uncharacterized protein YjhX (UPF0386 family)